VDSTNTIELKIPIHSGVAEIAIPVDASEDELKTISQSILNTLQTLKSLNPDLNVDVPALFGTQEAPKKAAPVAVAPEDKKASFVISRNNSHEDAAQTAGNFLRDFREDQNADRKSISEATGIAYSSVFNLEKGKSVPSLETLAKIADAYQSDVKVTFVPRG
jgi:DNA-binding XRE family transcriptional regulator